MQVYTAQQIQEGAKSGQWASQNKRNGAVFVNNPALPASAQPTNTNAQMKNVSTSDIQPSGNYRDLNLDFLQMQYPDNWKVIGDQQQSSITIAPPSGVSGNNIAYGVMINGAQAQNGQSQDLDQMTNSIIQSFRQGNPDLQQVGSLKTITVNGVRGRSVDLKSTSPMTGPNGQPLPERDWLVTVPRNDGSVLFFVFIAPQNDFDHLRPTYETMLRSLRLQQ